MTNRAAIERTLVRAAVWVIAGAALGAASGLLVSAPAATNLLVFTTVHLSLLVAFGFAVAWDLARYLAGPWFWWLGPVSRRLAAAASVVALTTGVVALVTLAFSAALRYAPSLQFLQLLSALDIAWVVAATLIGVRWLWGRAAGAAAALTVAVLCIWSIWNYLRVVGFAADGGWHVDGAALFRYVLPYDMAAALVAVTALALGARRRTGVATTVTAEA